MTRYRLGISEEAREQLRALPKDRRVQIGARLTLLQNNLSGDVKKLVGSENKYRLRVGKYRVMFLIVGDLIGIYSVKDRKEAYD